MSFIRLGRHVLHLGAYGSSVCIAPSLHRIFVPEHGWYVKGLEPAGQAWNSSAPGEHHEEPRTIHVQSRIKRRLHGDGMGLHAPAVFSATLSDLVHHEASSDVRDPVQQDCLALSTEGARCHV